MSETLTAEERAREADVTKLVLALPGAKLFGVSLGQGGAPDMVEFDWKTQSDHSHHVFRFFEMSSLRRYVLHLGRQALKEAIEGQTWMRQRLDEKAVEVRKVEALVAELERDLR